MRRVTLEALAVRDDTWLDRTVASAPKLNAHCVWFHVAEHDIHHRGQIRWLRARLPKGQANEQGVRPHTSSGVMQSTVEQAGSREAQRVRAIAWAIAIALPRPGSCWTRPDGAPTLRGAGREGAWNEQHRVATVWIL